MAAAAVVTIDKLDWMNAQYLSRLPVGELVSRARAVIKEAGLEGSPLVRDEAAFSRLMEVGT